MSIGSYQQYRQQQQQILQQQQQLHQLFGGGGGHVNAAAAAALALSNGGKGAGAHTYQPYSLVESQLMSDYLSNNAAPPQSATLELPSTFFTGNETLESVVGECKLSTGEG